MRWGTTIVDHPRSYPHGPPAVRVDTSQLQAAARELEALALHEQARHLAELHATLAELRRDVQITDAELDAQAGYLALLERGDRFLQDVAARLQPGSELLALARQVDDHDLGVWRQAAGSLVDDCPPALVHLRWGVEEEQRAELRSHAHLVRTEAQLSGLRRRLSLVGRWWRRRRAVELAGQLADCQVRRQRSARRLAHLDAKLQVIDNTEHARAGLDRPSPRDPSPRGGCRAGAGRTPAAASGRPADRCGTAIPPRPQQPCTAWCGVVTAGLRPARPCTWNDCPHLAAATVVFELPNLLAGSRRDYCAAHTKQVRMARGAVIVARFGPNPPALPDGPAGRRAARASRIRRKGVVP